MPLWDMYFNHIKNKPFQGKGLLETYIQSVPGGKVNILGGHRISHSKQKIHMYLCPVPSGFRDKDISLYSSKFVVKKAILLTVSNTGIYYSSDKVGIIFLV
jgi:hypothetical protein